MNQGGSLARNQRAFVPVHTPDRPSRPVTDAPSEEKCYALLSGRSKTQQQGAGGSRTPSSSYPTHHDSVGGGSSRLSASSGMLVVHLDIPPQPAPPVMYENPRPAPLPWLRTAGRQSRPGSAGGGGKGHSHRPCSPSPMRQQQQTTAATAGNSGSSGSSSRRRYCHDKELPLPRIDDEVRRAQRGGKGAGKSADGEEERLREPRNRWRSFNSPGGDRNERSGTGSRGNGHIAMAMASRHQQPRGVLSSSPSSSGTEVATGVYRQRHRGAGEVRDQGSGAAIAPGQHLSKNRGKDGSGSGSGSVRSASSGSYYGDGDDYPEGKVEEVAGRQSKRRRSSAFEYGAQAALFGRSKGFVSDHADEVDSSRGRRKGVALMAAPCPPRQVEAVNIPTLARPEKATDAHQNMLEFSFTTTVVSTPGSAQEKSNGGSNARTAAAAAAAACRHRLPVAEQRPVPFVDDSSDDDDCDGRVPGWNSQWNPDYYFGGSRDGVSTRSTPTLPILSKLQGKGEGEEMTLPATVFRRREEPTSFI